MVFSNRTTTGYLFWSKRVIAEKFSFGKDGAYLAHINAFVLAGLPTTKTLTDFFANLSKASPCKSRKNLYNNLLFIPSQSSDLSKLYIVKTQEVCLRWPTAQDEASLIPLKVAALWLIINECTPIYNEERTHPRSTSGFIWQFFRKILRFWQENLTIFEKSDGLYWSIWLFFRKIWQLFHENLAFFKENLPILPEKLLFL